jgi:hypothetical protein
MNCKAHRVTSPVHSSGSIPAVQKWVSTVAINLVATFCVIPVSNIFRLAHIFSGRIFRQTETKTETKTAKARKKGLNHVG